MIDASDPSQAHELGQLWNALGNEIMEFGASLQRTATSSEAIWIGQAGDTARAALSALATWSQHPGQGAQFMATTVRTQAEAAETARAAMPEPVPYDPAKYQAQLNSTINPGEWFRIMGDAREQADRHNAAHAEAITVAETYSASLRDTNAMMPAFTPPPKFGDGDTGCTPGGSTPGGRAAGMLPPAGGAGGTVPGSSAPGGALGIDGAAPPTAAAGRRMGGAGGEFGPRGSGGLSTSNLLGRGGVGSAADATGAGRGTASLAGHGGGAGNGFAPMAGAGLGQGEEDTEHRRPSYLVETEDIWGDGRHVAPPVIGEDPPDYHY